MSTFVFKEGRLPGEAVRDIAAREKKLRKARHLTQQQLAQKAGVSLGSLRRFEQTGSIAFESLVSIAYALGCENDLDGLFAQPAYASIEEVIADARKTR